MTTIRQKNVGEKNSPPESALIISNGLASDRQFIVSSYSGSRSHQYCFSSFFCAGHIWSRVSPSNNSPFFIT
jgi:hypothetical protein